MGFRSGGKQYLRSTGTADKREAQRMVSQLKSMQGAVRRGQLNQELFAILTGTDAKPVALETAIQDWLHEGAGHWSSQTIRRYGKVAQRIQRMFPGATLGELTTLNIRTALNKANLTPAGYNGLLSALKSLFRHCTENRLIPANPSLPIKPRRQPPVRKRRAFTPAEVATLLNAVEEDPFWKWMILSGAFTGQRLGDVVHARWEDLRDGVW